MPTNHEAVTLTRTELIAFCEEFLAHPYLCYTEHGQHCRFASRLYQAIPAGERYQTLGGLRMCRVQKEYPTHKDLSKSRRQHWDVSLIAKAAELPRCQWPHDHLPLATVVEFGLNCDLDHLQDDIQRLSHRDSNVHQGFAAHLFRLSAPRERPSARDWSPNSRLLHAKEVIQPRLADTMIEVYLGVFDPTNTNPNGLWRITASKIVTLTSAGLPPEAASLPEDQTENIYLDS
jgi:hypothetical protein